jgi:hypothetical protein
MQVKELARKVKQAGTVEAAREILNNNDWGCYSDDNDHFPAASEGWCGPDGKPISHILFSVDTTEGDEGDRLPWGKRPIISVSWKMDSNQKWEKV